MKKIFRILCIVAVALVFVACDNSNKYGTDYETTISTLGPPPSNEIWFTTTDGKELLFLDENAFDVAVTEVAYSEYDINVIRFAAPVTVVGDEAFRDCTNIFNLSLPSSVTTIGERAFFDCKNMECLTLGSGLRSCGTDAFEGCYNLYSLHIPSIQMWCRVSFATMRANPLYFSEHLIIENEKISTLNIPDGTESIHDYAFVYNMRLRDVVVPSSLKSIGKSAFEGCEGIQSVKISSIKAWCGIDFADELSNPLSIAENLYVGEVAVSEVAVSGITEVSSYAFINCTTITSFSADDTLSEIGTDAFRNCEKLTSVSLGSGIGRIGKQAFMNCKQLSKVVCNATNPPQLGNGDVFSLNAESRKFYVAGTAVERYQNDAMWSKYADCIEAIE